MSFVLKVATSWLRSGWTSESVELLRETVDWGVATRGSGMVFMASLSCDELLSWGVEMDLVTVLVGVLRVAERILESGGRDRVPLAVSATGLELYSKGAA